MGTVVKLSEARRRVTPAPTPARPGRDPLGRRLVRASSRSARFFGRIVGDVTADAAGTLLRLFDFPIRVASRLALLALVASIAIECFTHWREPKIVLWTAAITFVLILVHAVFEGLAGALRRLQLRRTP